MTTKKFSVGDRVTVFGEPSVVPFQSGPSAIRNVARVMKRFVELNDGSQWSLTGYPYPRDPYPRQHIEHTTEEHEKELALVRARQEIEYARLRPSAYSDEAILKAAKILHQSRSTQKKDKVDGTEV